MTSDTLDVQEDGKQRLPSSSSEIKSSETERRSILKTPTVTSETGEYPSIQYDTYLPPDVKTELEEALKDSPEEYSRDPDSIHIEVVEDAPVETNNPGQNDAPLGSLSELADAHDDVFDENEEVKDDIKIEQKKSLEEIISAKEKRRRNLRFIGISIFGIIVVLASIVSGVLLGRQGCLEITSMSNPIIQLRNGLQLIGKQHEKYENVFAFYSVPYAMPPTGDGRFKPPSQIPYVQWFDLHIVWNATQFIHTCFQPKMSEDDLDYLESESCLFVNIFTPAMLSDGTSNESTAKRKYPVLIDLHGGGFMSGSSMNNNGAHLANKHQMVVVHANYRLAEFGYWYSDNEPDAANAGFLDQQLAIEWVHQQIDAFGGDRERITLLGCSSGGQSVLDHLYNERSSKAFSQAIVLSAPSGIPYLKKAQANSQYSVIAANVSCCNNGRTLNSELNITSEYDRCLNFPTDTSGQNMTCLRRKSPYVLRDASFTASTVLGGLIHSLRQSIFEPFLPVLHSETIKDNSYTLLKSTEFPSKKSIIFEVTAEESQPFLNKFVHEIFPSDNLTLLEELWPERILRSYFDDNWAVVADIYSKHCGYGSVSEKSACSLMDQAKQFYTDYLFTCNQRSFMNELSSRNNPKLTYSVFFDQPLPVGATSSETDSFCEDKTCHCSGNWWLFSKNIDESCDLTQEQMKIQQSYQNLYANFIHTGNPNSYMENLNEQLDHEAMLDWQRSKSWFYIGKEGIKQTDWNLPGSNSQLKSRCDLLDSLDKYLQF